MRLLAATNRDLGGAVTAGHYRSDFYYRLSATMIRLPPLRARGEDIGRLIDYYLRTIEHDIDGTMELSMAARQVLTSYPWPGNIRELQNALRRARLVAHASVVDISDLPADIREGRGDSQVSQARLPDGMTLHQAWMTFERRCIAQALEECRGNREATARRLGIDSKTLRRKLAGDIWTSVDRCP